MRDEIAWPFIPIQSNISIASARGCYLTTTDGQQLLDAAGGAIVVNVGHGRKRVADAVARAIQHCTYIVPPWLTPSREALMRRLQSEWLSDGLNRVHLCSGGSEGNETAMKIALQYHAARGESQRHKIVGRDLSYHGTTLATTAVGGHEARKLGLSHALNSYLKVAAPYPLRCPLGRHHPEAGQFYVKAFESLIEQEGGDTIAAFLTEPITGSSGGAIVPPEDYLPGIQALCRKHGILLLLDEVMTGFGRTGLAFGYQHWDIQPDVVVSGKGLSGGYAPIVGVFAREHIASSIAGAGMNVMFHTFGAHPAACAAAESVLQIMSEEKLVERARVQGGKLNDLLHDLLANHPHVAEIRGKGLLQAVEVVADRDSLEPFEEAAHITHRIVRAAMQRGVFFYGGGTGSIRDIICMGPPLIIEDDELDRMANVLKQAIDEVTG